MGKKTLPGCRLTSHARIILLTAAARTVLSLIPSAVGETTWLGSLGTMGTVGWLKEKGGGRGVNKLKMQQNRSPVCLKCQVTLTQQTEHEVKSHSSSQQLHNQKRQFIKLCPV